MQTTCVKRSNALGFDGQQWLTMIKAGRNSRAAYHLVLHVRAIPLVFKVDGKHDGRATIMKDGCLPTKFQQKKGSKSSSWISG